MSAFSYDYSDMVVLDKSQLSKSSATKPKPEHPSAHAVIAGHRHSLPLQNKMHELNLKCNCNLGNAEAKPPIEKSILERRQNILLDDRNSKIIRSRKKQRDAATSPQLPNRNGTKVENGSPCRSIAIARPSPRREIPMRNAATSPQREERKPPAQSQAINVNVPPPPPPPSPPPPPLQVADTKPVTPKPIKNEMASKIILEKSKSLSDTRPARQLRTTRSLSPRPPVRHQQAIIISDENDIVLKVTPSEYFDDDEVFANDDNLKIRKPKGKAQSENTSPNLSHPGGSFFAEDRLINNRSTGCLVYVPSDPWMKQSDKEAIGRCVQNARCATLKEKSMNLKSLDNDPWIFRRTGNGTGSNGNNNHHKHMTGSLNRQSKSISNIDDDDGGGGGGIPLTANRPKLQRSKTPATTAGDDCMVLAGDINYRKRTNDAPPPKAMHNNWATLTDTVATQKKLSHLISPQKLPLPTATAQSQSIASSTSDNQKRAQNFLLNVSNPNMLQPRHSFSTLMPPKDDELQLNIRRLSEQIKAPSGCVSSTLPSSSSSCVAPSADFSTYLSQIKQTVNAGGGGGGGGGAKTSITASAMAKKTLKGNTLSIEADLVLETTC